MMRRRKDRVAAAVQEERTKLGPEIALASQVVGALGQLAVLGQEPAATVFADALRSVDAVTRIKLVRDAFTSLPADRQVTMLSALFGDDALRQALLRENSLRQAEAYNSQLHLIRQEAAMHQRVNIAGLPTGASMEVGLFTAKNISDGQEYGGESDRWEHRLKLRHLGEGKLHVLLDESAANSRGQKVGSNIESLEEVPRTGFKTHDIIEVGTLYNGTAQEFDYYIFQSTPCAMRASTGSEWETTDLLVGYVLLDGADAFDLADGF